MKKLTDLKNFLEYEIIILHDGELEFQNYLAHIVNRSFSSELKEILAKYRKINIEQVVRLEKLVPRNSDRHGDQMINTVMRELIYNAKKLYDMSDDPEVRDVIIVISIQRINNYKVACYGALCSYASALDMHEILPELEKTLVEEKENYKLLATLGNKNLNACARIPLSDL